MITVQVNKIYLPFLTADTPRTQIFFGGSGSGKSVFIAQRVVLDILKGGRNFLIIRNVARTLRTSSFNEIVKFIVLCGLSDQFKIKDLNVTCKNGYQILFAGLDDVEKIKSITPLKGVITDIWVEEATETEESDIIQLYKRLRGQSEYPKRVVLSFNPILQSIWIYKKYFTNWEDKKTLYKDSNISILKTTYKDNAFLAEDDIKALEAEEDKYYHDVYTLGNWGVLGAAIFRNWEVTSIKDQVKTFGTKRFGLDFGFGDNPAALVCCAYDPNHKTIYIYDELYRTELTNDYLTLEVEKKTGFSMIVADCAEPKSITELKNNGLKIYGSKKGKDSINFGIQWLQQHKIIVDTSCVNMRKELQLYKWREDKYGVALPFPVDKDNHLIDALRYAFENDMIQSKLKVIQKRMIGIQ